MISDRNVDQKNGRLGRDHAELTFWTADTTDPSTLHSLNGWRAVKTVDQFKKLLAAAVDRFPAIRDPERNSEQKHVTLFVHGYNTDWIDSVRDYLKVFDNLFSGQDGLGLCVLFTWPSDGMKLGYFPDRLDARKSAPDLADVLGELYDWLAEQEEIGATTPKKGCIAKTSLISHSMGNFVMQKAMQLVWTRKNQPLLVSLINQLLMVAADVDNDLFQGSEAIDKSDGDAITNLAYRVTALYTGRDPVLGLSAGLKHFGKRRLGRSGLADACAVPDNVWQVDCSSLISNDATGIHSSYFVEPRTVALMREILRGVDRQVLVSKGLAPATTPCPPRQPAPVMPLVTVPV